MIFWTLGKLRLESCCCCCLSGRGRSEEDKEQEEEEEERQEEVVDVVRRMRGNFFLEYDRARWIPLARLPQG